MYPAAGYPALPLCANDVQAVKKALIDTEEKMS